MNEVDQREPKRRTPVTSSVLGGVFGVILLIMILTSFVVVVPKALRCFT